MNVQFLAVDAPGFTPKGRAAQGISSLTLGLKAYFL